MLLEKTALLATIGVSLFAPADAFAVYGEWNDYYTDTPSSTDSKSVISSEHKNQSKPAGTYDGVMFGYASYYITDNTVKNVKSCNNEGTIDSGVITQSMVYGGKAEYSGDNENVTVQANGNKVTYKNGSRFVVSFLNEISGGNAVNNGKEGIVEASGNEVIFEKGVSVASNISGVGIRIFGGLVENTDSGTSSGFASNNKVILYDPTVESGLGLLIIGGGDVYSKGNASALENEVYLYDVLTEDVIGGSAISEVSATTANNNTVVLNGGTYSGMVCGGKARGYENSTAEAVNNRIELRNGTAGAPDFAGTATLYGGYASTNYNEAEDTGDEGTSTGNSLNFYDVKEMKAGNIGYFQILNYEYSEMRAGDVILTLNGTDDEKTTSIANAEVNVSVVSLYGEDGQSEFKTGDKVVLLKNENGLDTDGITTKATITAETGISLTYEVEVQANDTELYLTRTGTRSVVLPGTKAIAEGAAAGLALASESSNATMEFLRDFSLSGGSITPFVHTQASSMRHETGSSINMSTVSLLAGLGTGFETGAGNLSLGAFFEYGKGSYTTNNTFDNRSDIDGDGNSWYMGGGILAKMEFLQTGPGHFYLEGSAHMGTLHNEYDSNDLYDASGNVAKFDMDSPYYSLHGGIGYVWDITDEHELDVYGKYIWTRVQGTDDTLTTKDKFEYDDMDSNRVRFGARYSYKGSERFSPYVGAAYEHEFSGSCDSKAYGHPVAAPSFEGDSFMGELGLTMKPSEDLPLSINLGVQGYTGQKQGISGSCSFVYEF